MRRHLRDALIRTARILIKLGNRIDGPVVTRYDDQWNKVEPPKRTPRGLQEALAIWSGGR